MSKNVTIGKISQEVGNMKIKKFVLFGVICVLAVFLSISAYAAETDGIFTYTVKNEQATVTGIDWEGLDEIVIPETLGGYEVTSLARGIMKDGTYEFGDNPVDGDEY